MAISSPGIGSNLDVNSIVSQLVALELKPKEKVVAQANILQTQISAFGQVKSLVDALGSAAAALAKPALWTTTKAASASDAQLTATATAGATPGTYSVQVDTLAKSQTLASGLPPYASATAAVGGGKLVIDVGTWAAGNASFAPKEGSTAIELEFADGATLAEVRDAINAANKGVTAAIVTDANGARLTLRSQSTGLDSTLRIVATDTAGTPITTGLGALAYDPPSGAAGLTETQPAANATVLINGLPVESTSNKLSGVLDGVTLDLLQTTTTPVTVTVSNDTATMKAAVQKFADAYNALNNFLATQTKYDEESKTAGILQGDSSAVGLRNQMRGLLRQASGGSEALTRLSDVGFDVQRDGSIVLDNAKLDAGLAKPGEMSQLFAIDAPGTTAADGMAVRFKSLSDQINGTGGLIDSRNTGLKARLERNSDEQQRIEDRAARMEERLLRQYQALDVTISKLNSLQTYVTQQLTALQNQNNNNDN